MSIIDNKVSLFFSNSKQKVIKYRFFELSIRLKLHLFNHELISREFAKLNDSK